MFCFVLFCNYVLTLLLVGLSCLGDRKVIHLVKLVHQQSPRPMGDLT